MVNKLKKTFVENYEAGYIDDEGYVLDSIPLAKFNELRKSGSIKQVGDNFKLCKGISHHLNIQLEKDADALEVSEYEHMVEKTVKAYFSGEDLSGNGEFSTDLGFEENWARDNLYSGDMYIETIFGYMDVPYNAHGIEDFKEKLIDDYKYMDKVVEKFKTQLDAEADAAWASVKSQLKTLAYETPYSVKFTPKGYIVPVTLEIEWAY